MFTDDRYYILGSISIDKGDKLIKVVIYYKRGYLFVLVIECFWWGELYTLIGQGFTFSPQVSLKRGRILSKSNLLLILYYFVSKRYVSC